MAHHEKFNSFPALPEARRRFIQAAGALIALPLVGCGGGGGGGFAAPTSGTGQPDAAPLADTTSGKFRGQRSGGVASYLGIPYAQPPVGGLRFQSPKPFKPVAANVLNADSFGAASLQTLPPYVTWIYPVPMQQSEDCLTVNVWAPANAIGAPVIVWIHGGAWRTGAAGMPLMNGQALAALGVVVVTVNFRLGALGGLSHPDLADADTGSVANWQLQDQMAALQWVHQNAAAFGGDANNICLMGQSAGGTSAAVIAQNPAHRKLLRKVVLLSPASNAKPGGFSLDDAAAYTELLATRLNTTPRGLRDVPAAALHAAEVALNALPLPDAITTGRASKFVPIIDAKFCLADWTRTEWPADLPVVITTTLTEGTFFVDLIDPATHKALTAPLPQDDTQLLQAVTSITRSAEASSRVVESYRKAAADEARSTDAGDLWVEIYGDFAIRNHSVRYAGKLASEGKDVRFGTYAHALKAPGHGVPHCADLPLLFGTYGLDYYKDKVGNGAAEAQLSAAMASAFASFARDSQAVAFDASTAWPRYGGSLANAVRMGEGSSGSVAVGTVPKLAQLAVWDAILGY
ncbi:putative carboxylesterase [Variovorax paradoxus B4]|uniref:Carboxylic ester hydrolase n=1 Tax=Variovorax paradoxus B4 TaxID=1246301 RepID=T1XKG0_VARPD|nr:carboxylesterase family protein [Variovorax paradoxus]AGU52794.1 putative carboxylesterase [Variovorax paradoxus B4]